MKLSQCRFSSRIAIFLSALFAVMFFCQTAQAACAECGTVTDVKAVKIEGHASGAGAVAGGVLGGVLGNQIGAGTGRDLATIGGAAGGAYAGHQVEKKMKSRTEYHVTVEMENGSTQIFKYSSKTSYQVGDRVKVKNGKLVRP